MADPFRLRVQKALTAALEEITPDNGYVSDLAPFLSEGDQEKRVFRGRIYFGEGDPLPMVSILEDPIQPEHDLGSPRSSKGRTNWVLLLQGFVDDDPVNPTDPAHFLMADVKRRLVLLKESENSSVGLLGFGTKAPMVESLEFDGGVVRPPDAEVSATAYFWMRLELALVEDHKESFA